MKILVVGHMTLGSNSRSLADGFAQAGHEVRRVDTSSVSSPRIGSALWMSQRWRHRATQQHDSRLRASIKEIQAGYKPDLLVAIKTIMFDQDILLGAGATRAIHVSFDDVSNQDNTTPRYLQAERSWDAVVTTKKHNVPELEGRGVTQVIEIAGAYDPSYHRITVPFESRPYTIGFVGAARQDRRRLPTAMAENFPDQSVVYGPRWRRYYPRGVKGTLLRPNASYNEYTHAANTFQIGLVLLNSENRDTHTMRSYETPACGQLFLGQRTDEHQDMLEDGKEALFFDSPEELWSHARRITHDLPSMMRIALAGNRRLRSGKNTYRDRAIEILEAVNDL